MTGDVVAFLRARIDEDEAAARAAGSGPWRWHHGVGEMCNDKDCPFGALMQEKDDGTLCGLMEVHGYDVHDEWSGGPHIARHDPARVLAEVAAIRAVIEEMEASWSVMTHLAAVYADHPDYQQEWAP